MSEKLVPKEETTAPPCQCACPAGIDVPRYIRRIKDGKFDEALAVIRERIPFPSICGFACYKSLLGTIHCHIYQLCNIDCLVLQVSMSKFRRGVRGTLHLSFHRRS